jgi:8-oxo-dGTP pyrophosphatase MutT (NUDIX family)
MTPAYRDSLIKTNPADASWRQAAVLILLQAEAGGYRFPLIVRSKSPGVHSGQIALPGGRVEAGESAEATARREFEEELGCPVPELLQIRPLTALPVPPSRFVIQPFVALCEQRLEYRPDAREVHSVFEIGLSELQNDNNKHSDTSLYDGQYWQIPYYRLQDHRIWGATAMILAELEALLKTV